MLPSQRRKAQNRASQRAFRERQVQRISELESELKGARESMFMLYQAYKRLHIDYKHLLSFKKRSSNRAVYRPVTYMQESARDRRGE